MFLRLIRNGKSPLRLFGEYFVKMINSTANYAVHGIYNKDPECFPENSVVSFFRLDISVT